MQPTKIEWVRNNDGTQGMTSNPVTGLCPLACPYCYSRGFHKRFQRDPRIRFKEREVIKWGSRNKPTTIFVGSMIELWGNWIPSGWLTVILSSTQLAFQHRYLFLSKLPHRYTEFTDLYSDLRNCWFGTTVDYPGTAEARLRVLNRELDGHLKTFVSFEPLLGDVLKDVNLDESIDWIIIGAQSKPERQPRREWVERILVEADRCGVPVFMKDNLRWANKRQEIPWLISG